MKKHARKFITVIALALLVVGAYTFFIGPHNAGACGWGQSGGGDYSLQRRSDPGQGNSSYYAQRQAITPEQARGIVANHIRKLNAELEVGAINDAGSFYEAEIMTKDAEVVQVLGVDKFTGQLSLLN